MSDVNPMEQAAAQAGQSAAMSLQVLLMAAKILRERQERQAAQGNPSTVTVPQPTPQPAPNLDHARYAQMVRETVTPAEVAEAMVMSAGWPQLAEELKKLEAAGVDARQFLGDASPLIARIDNDLRAGAANPGVVVPQAIPQPRDPWAPPPGQRRPDREGPGLGERIGQAVKKAVEWIRDRFTRTKPYDRAAQLQHHGISPQENARLVIVARESLADERLLGQLVTSREWPSIAAQMRTLQGTGRDPREALAGVPVRMKQAADAGIGLSPAEAARGLLNEQAAAPAPTATGPALAPTPGPVAAADTTTPPAPGAVAPSTTASPVPAPAAARAEAATAQSPTATPGSTPAPGPAAARTTQPPAQAPTRSHGR